MLLNNLGLIGIYLLFLSVQLNLKYTFSNFIFSDYSSSNANTKTSGLIGKSQNDKSTVQKLRLNKRYVHQEVYLVDPFVVRVIAKYYIKVDKTFLPVPRISSAYICHASLRGPPYDTTPYC